MKIKAKKVLIILMFVLLVTSVTASSVNASPDKASKHFLKADFSASPISGHAPLKVHFTDHSRSHARIISWSWNFGDGKTSSSKNPTHVYKHPGKCPVA